MAAKREVFRGGFIDELGTYDTLQTWERHLAKIKAMDFAAAAVPSKGPMLRTARETIAMKKRVARQFNAKSIKRT
jgi:hypothetical protein